MRPVPHETWPKLSEDLRGPRDLERCQACAALEWADLSRWREHDDSDLPTHVVVVLCRPCAKRLIGPHPRLYGELHPNDPHPGSMAICRTCDHRDGTRCAHPDAKANGGPGVTLAIPRPAHLRLSRAGPGGSRSLRLWTSPASDCNRRSSESLVMPEPMADTRGE